MTNTYTPPSFNANAFNCPHCNAYAQQKWFNTAKTVKIISRGVPDPSSSINTRHQGLVNNLLISYCTNCNDYSLWLREKMIYPKSSNTPLPHEDMPEDVKKDFLEARNIVNESSRGACALLRLSLQKLMPHLEEEDKNLNTAIGNLVKNGLPVEIQQALDSVRVIGNEAVHPGQLDLKDNVETALTLFELLNLVIDRMIAQPKKIQEIYERLPESKKQGIENRDRNKN